jgi:hypothetical protein
MGCPQPLHEEEAWSEPRTIDAVMKGENNNPEADDAEGELSGTGTGSNTLTSSHSYLRPSASHKEPHRQRSSHSEAQERDCPVRQRTPARDRRRKP